MDNNANAQITEEELNQMSDEQLLDLFVEQLLTDKGLDALEGEIRKEVHDDLKEKVVFELNRAILAALPEEEFDKLNAKIEAGEVDGEAITETVKNSGIDIDKITETAMMDFRKAFLEEPEEPAEKQEG